MLNYDNFLIDTNNQGNIKYKGFIESFKIGQENKEIPPIEEINDWDTQDFKKVFYYQFESLVLKSFYSYRKFLCELVLWAAKNGVKVEPYIPMNIDRIKYDSMVNSEQEKKYVCETLDEILDLIDKIGSVATSNILKYKVIAIFLWNDIECKDIVNEKKADFQAPPYLLNGKRIDDKYGEIIKKYCELTVDVCGSTSRKLVLKDSIYVFRTFKSAKVDKNKIRQWVAEVSAMLKQVGIDKTLTVRSIQRSSCYQKARNQQTLKERKSILGY